MVRTTGDPLDAGPERGPRVIVLCAPCGVENELFYNPMTEMLFGDAKKSIEQLVAEVKALNRRAKAPE